MYTAARWVNLKPRLKRYNTIEQAVKVAKQRAKNLATVPPNPVFIYQDDDGETFFVSNYNSRGTKKIAEIWPPNGKINYFRQFE